jgi:hypothetical protein
LHFDFIGSRSGKAGPPDFARLRLAARSACDFPLPKPWAFRVETTSMRLAIVSMSALLFGIGVAGCSDDKDDDDSMMVKDSGTMSDAGTPADSGMTDTGAVPDTGVPGPCDPTNGTGCTEVDEFCVYQLSMNVTQCRTLPPQAMQRQHEQSCNELQQDCAPGLTCANAGQGPLCYQVCDAAAANPCAGVTGMSSDYLCGLFDIMGQPSTYGLCQGSDVCNPAEKAAACMNETCTIVTAQADTACQPSGTAMVGQACSPQNNCVAGAICVDIGSGAVCWEACDTANPCTNLMATCLDLQNIDWGLCREPGMACDPLAMPCMAGQTCSVLTGAAECTTSGPGTPGAVCSAQAQCVDGAVCALLNGQGPDPKCYEPCNLMTPMCSAGQCANIGLPFGLCVP